MKANPYRVVTEREPTRGDRLAAIAEVGARFFGARVSARASRLAEKILAKAERVARRGRSEEYFTVRQPWFWSYSEGYSLAVRVAEILRAEGLRAEIARGPGEHGPLSPVLRVSWGG